MSENKIHLTPAMRAGIKLKILRRMKKDPEYAKRVKEILEKKFNTVVTCI